MVARTTSTRSSCSSCCFFWGGLLAIHVFPAPRGTGGNSPNDFGRMPLMMIVKENVIRYSPGFRFGSDKRNRYARN